jgi:hypothetical protein
VRLLLVLIGLVKGEWLLLLVVVAMMEEDEEQEEEEQEEEQLSMDRLLE